MAIKTKLRRDTYRSNVKKRPLRQNGLEAQYQGIDIKEINIDHSGLPIIGRGGFQTRQKYTKVKKQYIVDVGAERYNPSAVLEFTPDFANWCTPNSGTVGTSNLQDDYDGVEITIVGPSSSSVSKTYIFSKTDPNSGGIETGQLDGLSRVVVNLFSNSPDKNSLRALYGELVTAIRSDHGHGRGIFEFVFGPVQNTSYEIDRDGSNAAVVHIPTDKYELAANTLKISTVSQTVNNAVITIPGSPSVLACNDNFQSTNLTYTWALNGYKEVGNEQLSHYVNAHGVPSFTTDPYFEDFRTDTLLNNRWDGQNYTALHRQEQRSDGTLGDGTSFGPGSIIVNADGHMLSQKGTGTTIDPTGLSSSTVELTDVITSDEVRLRGLPLREEVLNTSRVDDIWYEDIYWMGINERTWTNLQERYSQYHSSFVEHLTVMIDGVYFPAEDIPKTPLSGRIDVGGRVGRAYGLLSSLPTERSRCSFYNQFLEEIVDPINLQENRYPVEDRLSRDLACDDNLGRRFEDGWTLPLLGQHDFDNPILFIDFFDQMPIDTHDYKEVSYYSSIDEQIQQVMSDSEWDGDGVSELLITINHDFGLETGNIYFRNAPDGIEKKWFQIIFAPSATLGSSTGFNYDGGDGNTKDTAYTAFVGTPGAPAATIVAMLEKVLSDAPTAGQHTNPATPSSFSGWSNAANWTIATQTSIEPYWIKVTAVNDDSKWNFESIESEDFYRGGAVKSISYFPTSDSNWMGGFVDTAVNESVAGITYIGTAGSNASFDMSTKISGAHDLTLAINDVGSGYTVGDQWLISGYSSFSQSGSDVTVEVTEIESGNVSVAVSSNDSMTATNRSYTIDRREWQDPQHVITATGFINSQSSRQAGIVYRELLR